MKELDEYEDARAEEIFFLENPEYIDCTPEDFKSKEERSRAWYLTFMSLEEYEAMLDYQSKPPEELEY